MKRILSMILALSLVFCKLGLWQPFEACAIKENFIKSICKEFLENAQKMGQVCDAIREIRCGLSFFASTLYAAKGLFKENSKTEGFKQASQSLEEDVIKSEQLDEKLRGISYVISFAVSLCLAMKSLYDSLSSKVANGNHSEKNSKDPPTEIQKNNRKSSEALVKEKIESN